MKIFSKNWIFIPLPGEIWGIWLSSNNHPYLGYKIKQGDVIKFGRVRFRIKKISSTKEINPKEEGIMANSLHFTDNNNYIVDNDNSQHSFGSSAIFEMRKHVNEFFEHWNSELNFDEKGSEKSEIEKQSFQGDRQWRVCLCGNDDMSENGEDNPLFSVCTWAGSMKLIHLNWIRQWLEGKVHKKISKYIYSYNWKNLEWELCKTRFRDTHFHEGKLYNILNYERPKEGAYVILESFTNTPHKTIHVVSIDNESLKNKSIHSFLVGRENTVDVRITDISVSRAHSYINYYDGNFYISDNNSKFGNNFNIYETLYSYSEK